MRGHVEIAGAGFAGLAAAAAFARRGWSVRVHEAAPELRTVGSGLYVFPPAQRALRAIGALDAFMQVAYAPPTRSLYIDGEHRETRAAEGAFLTAPRHALLMVLADAARRAGAVIATNSQAVGATESGELLLADGTRLAADLVVAADGIRSGIARQMGIPIRRDRHEDGVIRILLDRRDLRGPRWDGSMDLYDYRFRPLRLLYSPCGDDAFYFALMAPAADTEASAVPVDAALWARSFPMFAAPLARVGDLGRYDRYTTTTLAHWAAGRVAIIGDAAHAMPSSLGQGAAVGMANAVELAATVDRASSIEDGLAEWHRTHRPEVERVQVLAEETIRSRSLTSTRHSGAYDVV